MQLIVQDKRLKGNIDIRQNVRGHSVSKASSSGRAGDGRCHFRGLTLCHHSIWWNTQINILSWQCEQVMSCLSKPVMDSKGLFKRLKTATERSFPGTVSSVVSLYMLGKVFQLIIIIKWGHYSNKTLYFMRTFQNSTYSQHYSVNDIVFGDV